MMEWQDGFIENIILDPLLILNIRLNYTSITDMSGKIEVM